MVKDMFNKLKNDNKLLFLIVSIIFTIFLSFASMFGDDLYLMHIAGNNIMDYWNESVSLYSTWSSRILINFLIYFFTDHNPLYWSLFMGISMYILLYSIYCLFSKKTIYNCLLIVAVILLFPFNIISTAGWIATTVTYFSPVTFGFLSLTPIKKALTNEKISALGYIVYALSLIFACNNEQMMALVLACYFVASLYFLINKKKTLFVYIQLLLTIASAVYTLTCPGNSVREASEISKWFPTFGSLGFSTKIDICFSTTMKWLLFDNMFFTLFSIIITLLIWNKYKAAFVRAISLIPSVILILCNYLKVITSNIFPYLSSLNKDIPYYGLVNAGDIYHTEAFFVYFVWISIILITIYEIIMLADSIETLLASLTLVGAGFASRMALSLSPTIYASGYRTCTIFIFALMATLILLINKSKADISKYRYILLTSAIIGFINFGFIVATTVA